MNLIKFLLKKKYHNICVIHNIFFLFLILIHQNDQKYKKILIYNLKKLKKNFQNMTNTT
jgi:hypothetical protein